MYNQIAANKRKTWFLLIVVVVLIIGLSAVFGLATDIDPGVTILGGTVVATIHALVSYFLGDKIALKTNGAKIIQKTDSPELWNLVENLCISNGQPMPKIYIIQDESPNAFATGRDPARASIAFTTGILKLLDKQELQGVAAHELSHVKNYDIRVMTIVVVLVGAVMLLSDIMLRSLGRMNRTNNRNGGQAALVLMLIGVVLAILSPLFAKLIQMSISRSREYLADASGALLTRYPEGLARALEKISATAQPLQKTNHATAHLFIANPYGKHQRRTALANLFSTHPPIEERINKLRGMGA